LKPVGIIANPASGKDIRRLVAYGSVFDNNEKINIIKRVLMALDSCGLAEVVMMPDYSGLGRVALDNVDVALNACFLDMDLSGPQADSTRAAAMMDQMGVACIITLGGDGTNRVVAKGCNDTPLLPISTGTNNVFPYMIEGTLAGIAAGVLATGGLTVNAASHRAPRLEVYRANELVDIALIDLVVTDDAFVGARAVWETETIKEVYLTRARPSNIGFSALGGYLNPLPLDTQSGLQILVGDGKQKVKTPIAPGLIVWLPIASHQIIEAGEDIVIQHSPAVLALDGEREVTVKPGERLVVRLNSDGPRVVDIDVVLAEAVDRGLFISTQ
jgi:predicted polyphosphate/ATP-dependent NAD kinase